MGSKYHRQNQNINYIHQPENLSANTMCLNIYKNIKKLLKRTFTEMVQKFHDLKRSLKDDNTRKKQKRRKDDGFAIQR